MKKLFKITTIDGIERIVSDKEKLQFYPTKNCVGSRIIVNGTISKLKEAISKGQYPALEVTTSKDPRILSKIKKLLKNGEYQPNSGIINYFSWEDPSQLVELLRSIGAITIVTYHRLYHVEIKYPQPFLLVDIVSKSRWSYHYYVSNVEEIKGE